MNCKTGMRGISKMGIIIKIIKYGVVFAAGYYLGSGCAYKPPRSYTPEKPSKLEQEVMKYEQENSKSPETKSRFFP